MSKTLLVGVGGAGCHLAAQWVQNSGLPMLAVNADTDALAQLTTSHKLVIKPHLGMPTTHMKMQAAAQAAASDFAQALAGFNRVIIIGGLGRKTATNALPPLIKAARQAGRNIMVVVTMPFSFESTRAQAQSALDALQDCGCDVTVHDHQLYEHQMPHGSMSDMLDGAASTVNAAVGEWLSRTSAR